MKQKVICILSVVFIVIVGIFSFAFATCAAEYTAGDIITLGSYPQTQVDDEILINELELLAENMSWEPIGYAKSPDAEYGFFKDVNYAGVKYRAIRFTRFNNNLSQTNYGYLMNTVYWFRFEPIKWRILDTESGLLHADSVLDTRPFATSAAEGYYMNNYAQSSVRKWLNGDFSDNAFSEKELDVIMLREQDNSCAGMDEKYAQFACENTSDKVFLLSDAEVCDSSLFSDRSSRIRVGTNYARAWGLENYYYLNLSTFPDNDYWFLRSPGNSEKNQGYVSSNGAAGYDIMTDSPDVGICPAVYVDLDAYDSLNLENEQTQSPYDGFEFDYADGILIVSGLGVLPTVEAIEETPLAAFSDECKVLFITDSVEGISENAFKDFTQLNTLILNTGLTVESGAFATNDLIKTVICSDTVQFAEDAFSEFVDVYFYEPKNAPHNGILPDSCNVIPYSFADGTLFFEGDVEMDMYEFLDLMAVMCSYYDDVRFVRFNSYTSVDVPFYVYEPDVESYVPADDNTLKGVSFSVKVSGEYDWEAITFNEFCALAGNNEVGTFHLVAETEAGEDVQETPIQIIMKTIQTGIKKVLKWIVSLLNYMFQILSKFK